MINSQKVLDIMVALKEMGFSLVIDDFGTGFSSLSYLKQFPVDSVKIDQSFVGECLSNESDAAIIRAVIALSHSLNLKLTVEGVENKGQLLFLEKEGCDRAQGVYFGKSVAPEKFTQLLNNDAMSPTDHS